MPIAILTLQCSNLYTPMAQRLKFCTIELLISPATRSIMWIHTGYSLARFLFTWLTNQVTKAIIHPCCQRSIIIVGTKTLKATSFSLYMHSSNELLAIASLYIQLYWRTSFGHQEAALHVVTMVVNGWCQCMQFYIAHLWDALLLQ